MTTAVSPAGRDRETGELLNKISINIHVKGELLPRLVYCRDWTAARKFLASAEFKHIADTVERLTITNREA
jgi:hypothetical protein